MKKEKVCYLLYISSVVTLTFYFSMLVVKEWMKPNYQLRGLIFLPYTSGECPCRKIGEEFPHCQIFYHKESSNPNLHVELKPGVKQIEDGFTICIPSYEVQINSHGFRDYEYPFEKPNNTFRIIVVGDSITFGQGVELNKTYTKVLEKMLNERMKNGYKYEVLNFGVPGYNAREKVEVVSIALKWNPDLIIFQYLGDDIVDWNKLKKIWNESIQKYTEKTGKDFQKLTRGELNMLFQKVYDEYLRELSTEKFDEAWKPVESAFKRLAYISKNIPVFIWVDGVDSNQLSELRKITEKYGWILFNMREVFLKYPIEEIVIHPKDGHPNAVGHKIIAESIFNQLMINGLLPTS